MAPVLEVKGTYGSGPREAEKKRLVDNKKNASLGLDDVPFARVGASMYITRKEVSAGLRTSHIIASQQN